MNASSAAGSTGLFQSSVSTMTVPLRLVSGQANIHRCKRNDGCQKNCSWSRTDAARLPWRPDGQYGGWGGHRYHETNRGIDRPPVVFVHGNQRDACDWDGYADFLGERGFGGDELWAISFRDGTPTHDEMATQLESFVTEVRDRTGAERVHVVAHSLGVTGTRYWMEREDRYDSVDTFVGLAGANHGQALSAWCKMAGIDHGVGRSSGFLRADYDTISDHPLAELNEGDETPGDVRYYTIRGTRDPLYWQNEQSPELDGAEQNVALQTDHDGVRTDLESKRRIYRWLAERDTPGRRTECRA